MTQLSQRALKMVVDHVAAHGSFEAAASHVNMSLSNIYAWRGKSKKDQESGDTSSPFYINGRWWHELLADARDTFLFGQELGDIEEQKAGSLGHASPKRPAMAKPEEWIPDPTPTRVVSVDTTRPASYAKPPKPPQHPSIAELRALAANPEERRKRFGASAYPMNERGQRTIPHGSPSLTADQPDDEGRGLRPVEVWHPPGTKLLSDNGSYMPAPGSQRRARPLDTGEQIGDGMDSIPPGGGPAWGRGNVR